MIGKTNVKGGKVSISIYGAKNEKVTYSGKASGTVTLNANGVGTVKLQTGDYTFTAGISGRTATVKVKMGAVVMLRPANFVYWYGVEVGRCAQTIYGYTVEKNIGFATVRADVPDGAELTVGCNDSPAVVVSKVFC